MARGTRTARACLMALAVGLLSLQLLVQGAPSASAHEPVTRTGAPVAACDDTELPRISAHHYLPRDRHRAEGYGPDGTVRGAACPWQVLAGDPGIASMTADGSPHRQPRRAADCLPVILQVFRC
ncbi:hypothetical protein ACFWVU_26580 [Streptomyces sp. NPDC058686]|uniref:hypothetical protein n=1 Tax=Streptomyces sp. NPDC058686 TaxID=3346599 RepID=UPI00365AAB37